MFITALHNQNKDIHLAGLFFKKAGYPMHKVIISNLRHHSSSLKNQLM
jgi:hypothetical protein